MIDTPGTLTNLIRFTKESGKPISGNLNEEIYLNIVKKLYCPCNLQPDVLRLECVRQISIKPPGKPHRHPKSWMPPVTALKNVANLINCQIAYLLTLRKLCCQSF